jgi:hypothetical protein
VTDAKDESALDCLSILEEVKRIAPKDREDQKLRLSQSLYDDFKKRCDKEGVSPALVVESLMRSFLRGLPDKK